MSKVIITFKDDSLLTIEKVANKRMSENHLHIRTIDIPSSEYMIAFSEIKIAKEILDN